MLNKLKNYINWALQFRLPILMILCTMVIPSCGLMTILSVDGLVKQERELSEIQDRGVDVDVALIENKKYGRGKNRSYAMVFKDYQNDNVFEIKVLSPRSDSEIGSIYRARKLKNKYIINDLWDGDRVLGWPIAIFSMMFLLVLVIFTVILAINKNAPNESLHRTEH